MCARRLCSFDLPWWGGDAAKWAAKAVANGAAQRTPQAIARALQPRSRRVLAALLPLGLMACSPPSAGPDWFPFQAGESQRYGVTWARDGEPAQQVVWQETWGQPSAWHDETAWPRRHSDGVRFWLQASDQGVRRVATQADIDDAPTDDPEPRWVLKAPYTVGTEWRVLSVPYLLRRTNEYPNDLRLTHQVWMQWRIEAVNERVQVPAGSFAPCLRVEGEGKLRLYVDPVRGFQDVPVLGTEWYCQGHGLVKWRRQEHVKSGFFTGGEVTAELL